MHNDSSVVGTALGPFEYEVDPAWTMAYAADIDDPSARDLDSLGSEWPLVCFRFHQENYRESQRGCGA
jgi:hypothetical protein